MVLWVFANITSKWFWYNHCTENHLFFPDALKRWSFQKNCAGTWSFLYYRERIYFLFPKIWSYTLDGKGKMIFLKKNTWKYVIFFRSPEKMVFPKRAVSAYDLSCIIWKDGIFFPRKHDLSSSGRKWKTASPSKYMETWCFAQRGKTVNLTYRVESWLFL